MSEVIEKTELRRHLVVLQTRVDQHFTQAVARTPQAFTCAPGCASCCVAGLSVFEIEAASLRQALQQLAQRDPEQRELVRKQANDHTRQACVLLVDNRCAVYADRPLLCRAHGLATKAVLDDGSTRIDHCPLNYTADQPPTASILVLDALNQPLAMLSELWSRSNGAHAKGQRIALADLAREPDPDVDPHA